MAYGDFKDLPRTTACDKVLHGKAFDIAKNPKYDGYQRGLASMAYKFFENNEIKLAEELQKPIIRDFKNEQFILN